MAETKNVVVEDCPTDIKSQEQKSSPSTVTTEKYYRVEREKRYDHLTGSQIVSLNLQLDSDVYEYKDDGNLNPTPVVAHKHKFLTNESFSDLKSLNQYLRDKAKIPAFLEIRNSPGKGLGVFTTAAVKANSFLGMYEGIFRPQNVNVNNNYLFAMVDGQTKPYGILDAENILFANWTRFVNDGKTPNITFTDLPHQVLVHIGNTDVPANTELLVSYGEQFWKNNPTKKLD